MPGTRCLWILGWLSLSVGLSATALQGQATGIASTTNSPARTLSGQVLNASTGAPVSRALVRIDDRAMLTDWKGQFEFDQLTSSGGELDIVKPGFYSADKLFDNGGQHIDLLQSAATLTLPLYPEALLTGKLTAADGNPRPGILVSAMRSLFIANQHQWNNAAESLTDAHGNFRLPVPPGDYRLQTPFMPPNAGTLEAILPLEVPSTGVIRVHGGEEQHFDLQPPTARMHAVTAWVEGGTPGIAPEIIARSASGSILPIRSQQTDKKGMYQMEMPEGSWTLTASEDSPNGLEQGDAKVTLLDHDLTSGVTIRLTPVPSFPVEILLDPSGTTSIQRPNPMALNVTLESIEADPLQGETAFHLTPGRDGGVAFHVPPGNYRLQLSGGGEWHVTGAEYGSSDLLRQNLVAAGSSSDMPIRLTVSDAAVSLKGTVSLHGGTAACWVYLVPSSPGAFPAFSRRSGSDGAFTFDHLPPGSYQALAFENRHSVDYRDAAALAPFATYASHVTVGPADQATVDLKAVPASEAAP